ncbi:MAG: hypothetical protein HW389_3783 [Bacteroidetes bacterium]|jgi:hypothetical protein|nr:hypothetical protein [Bacteroidota bacterium]MBM2845452.1 hypothetical protein [Bacteroidota bacterium]
MLRTLVVGLGEKPERVEEKGRVKTMNTKS